jgi:hypothetical protein
MGAGTVVVKLMKLLNTSFLRIAKFGNGNRIGNQIIQELKMSVGPDLGWIEIRMEPEIEWLGHGRIVDEFW